MMFEPLMIPSWGVFAKGGETLDIYTGENCVWSFFLNQGYQGTPSAIICAHKDDQIAQLLL